VRTRLPADELYALRVRGDSMSGAAILDGDVVLVRRQPTAVTGDVVVALVGDEATVKRLRIVRGHAELHPENPDFAPIVPDGHELRLLGRVLEVRRSLDDRGHEAGGGHRPSEA
jgi:repressor LexA